jgi:glycerol-3-phosphate dehydrogenase
LAIIQSAATHGAEVANYAEVYGFCLGEDGRRVRGVKIRDRLDETCYEVRAKVVFNCTGPWVDHLLGRIGPKVDLGSLKRSEGIHLITGPLINPGTAISAVTPRGRHCFLIPWRGHTLIGTTDSPYEGHPDDYRVTSEAIAALLGEINASFDGLNLSYNDVRYAYGGLRPLVRASGETPDTYTASRRYEIRDNAEDGLAGLITVEGGKWTTSRALAEKAIDYLRTHTRLAIGESISAGQYLTHAAIREMAAFEAEILAAHPQAASETMATLGRYYGKAYEDVLALSETDPRLAVPLNADGEILAQVVFAVRAEMAQTLLDIVLRRTGIATLGHPGAAVLEQVALVAAAELGWDEKRRQAELETADTYLRVPVLRKERDAQAV